MMDLAVYLHLPFCVRKCNYCDFFSIAARPELIDDYTRALVTEIIAAGERLNHPEIGTVYLGGGTPSLFSLFQVGQLLEALASAFVMPAGVEISMEANPGTVSPEGWKQYSRQGINRVSLGVQSLDAGNLKLLGRIHSVEEVYTAVSSLRRRGFTNYNIDLIYGLPGQTEESLRRELALLKHLLGSHLSAYSLQVEEDTPLYDAVAAGRLTMPDEDSTANMYEMIQEFAAAMGMGQYELSNWALPGYECRHNLAYWRMVPYLGLGAGAVSRLDQRRIRNICDVEAYMQGAVDGAIPGETLEVLDEGAMVQETLIMGLRLMEGISLPEFKDRFGREVTDYYPRVIPESIAEGSLVIEDNHLKLTPRTYLLANQVLCRF